MASLLHFPFYSPLLRGTRNANRLKGGWTKAVAAAQLTIDGKRNKILVPQLSHVAQLHLALLTLAKQRFLRRDIALFDVQVDKGCHFGTKNLRLERLEQIIDRANRIPLEYVRLLLADGREEDDVRPSLITADGPQCTSRWFCSALNVFKIFCSSFSRGTWIWVHWDEHFSPRPSRQ